MSADLDKIERAIDRAVREMLDVEPRAGFRDRVLDRVSGEGAARSSASRRSAWAVWIALPLAAAAVIVLAIALSRRVEPLPAAPVVAHADRHLPADSVAAPAQRRVEIPVASRARETQPRIANVAPPARGTVVAAAYTGDEDTPAIEPLHPITPVGVAPIVQDRIAPAEITVRPLNAIAELHIAPLTPPDRR